jgi:hypothetical protein
MVVEDMYIMDSDRKGKANAQLKERNKVAKERITKYNNDLWKE